MPDPYAEFQDAPEEEVDPYAEFADAEVSAEPVADAEPLPEAPPEPEPIREWTPRIQAMAERGQVRPLHVRQELPEIEISPGVDGEVGEPTTYATSYREETPQERFLRLRRQKESDPMVAGAEATGIDYDPRALGAKFAQSGLMGFGDEIVGGLRSVFGDDYDLERERVAAELRDLDARSPGSALTGDLTGALPWMLGGGLNPNVAARGGQALRGAGQAMQQGGRLARGAGRVAEGAGRALGSPAGSRIATGAAEGAAFGAVEGAGRAEPGSRLEGAMEGAGVGAAVGGAVPAAIEGVKGAGRAAVKGTQSLGLERLSLDSEEALTPEAREQARRMLEVSPEGRQMRAEAGEAAEGFQDLATSVDTELDRGQEMLQRLQDEGASIGDKAREFAETIEPLTEDAADSLLTQLGEIESKIVPMMDSTNPDRILLRQEAGMTPRRLNIVTSHLERATTAAQQAIESGSKRDAAEAYVALDRLKRELQKGINANSQSARDFAEEIQEPLRRYLMDSSIWGDAIAQKQMRLNEAFTDFIPLAENTRGLFRRDKAMRDYDLQGRMVTDPERVRQALISAGTRAGDVMMGRPGLGAEEQARRGFANLPRFAESQRRMIGELAETFETANSDARREALELARGASSIPDAVSRAQRAAELLTARRAAMSAKVPVIGTPAYRATELVEDALAPGAPIRNTDARGRAYSLLRRPQEGAEVFQFPTRRTVERAAAVGPTAGDEVETSEAMGSSPRVTQDAAIQLQQTGLDAQGAMRMLRSQGWSATEATELIQAASLRGWEALGSDEANAAMRFQEAMQNPNLQQEPE